jgi:hypothetical protein
MVMRFTQELNKSLTIGVLEISVATAYLFFFCANDSPVHT